MRKVKELNILSNIINLNVLKSGEGMVRLVPPWCLNWFLDYILHYIIKKEHNICVDSFMKE